MDIKCPHCGVGYEIEEKEFGRFVKCESCGKGFVVGTSDAQQVNVGEKSVEDILGMRTSVEQESKRQTQYTSQQKDESDLDEVYVRQRNTESGHGIEHAGGGGIAVFFAMLMANIVFAVLSYIVVGNQFDKIINRLEKMEESRHNDASQIYYLMGRMKIY